MMHSATQATIFAASPQVDCFKHSKNASGCCLAYEGGWVLELVTHSINSNNAHTSQGGVVWETRREKLVVG